MNHQSLNQYTCVITDPSIIPYLLDLIRVFNSSTSTPIMQLQWCIYILIFTSFDFLIRITSEISLWLLLILIRSQRFSLIIYILLKERAFPWNNGQLKISHFFDWFLFVFSSLFVAPVYNLARNCLGDSSCRDRHDDMKNLLFTFSSFWKFALEYRTFIKNLPFFSSFPPSRFPSPGTLIFFPHRL